MTGHVRHGPRRRGARGQMTVVFALTLTIFIGAMMLGIDASHLRAEAENAQRAANAAALAGVVFLPSFPSSANSRALAEARKNGFVPSATNGISVTTSIPSGYPNRLQVTVTEPVQLAFTSVLGLGPRTISRSATAEFAEPLEMGAPDYVLGYAPFPTQMSSGGTQGFYLIARGPYGQQENGDAYSQYYESYNGYGLNPQGSSNPNYSHLSDPCGGGAPPDACPGLTPNPDRNKINFDGYDFVVDNPFTNTLVIKIFDPYDEGPFDAVASSANKPSNHLPPGVYSNGLPDQYGCAAGNTHICDNPAYPTSTDPPPPYPVALHFTLQGPYQTTYDTTPKPVALAPTNIGGTVTCSSDCVLSNNSDGSFVAGDDPTYENCKPANTCSTAVSPYAYKFLNYAIIHNPGLYRIHVVTGVNTYGIYNGKYGNGGNAFGLAVCADTSPVLGGDPSNPAGPGPSYPATSNPDPGITASPANANWNQSSCPNPNNTSLPGVSAACANPGTAPADSCVHIYAENRMAIYNNLASGGTSGTSALVPLGYVPAAYAGKTLHIGLYDVGDIGGSTANNSVEVLTPAGDLTHFDTTQNAGFDSSLPYTWSVAPTDNGAVNTTTPSSGGSGYITEPSQTVTTPSAIGMLGARTGYYNGSWVNIDVPLVPWHGGSYDQMVQTFGGYWKMMYQIGSGSSGNDTTTWEISVAGSPVHLVN